MNDSQENKTRSQETWPVMWSSALSVTSESEFEPMQFPGPMPEESQAMQEQECKGYWVLSVLRNDAPDINPECKCQGQSVPHTPVQTAKTAVVLEQPPPQTFHVSPHRPSMP